MSIKIGDSLGFFANSSQEIDEAILKSEKALGTQAVVADQPSPSLEEDVPHQDPHQRLVLIVQLEHRRRLKSSTNRYSRKSQAQLKYLDSLVNADEEEIKGIMVDKAA